MAGHVDCTEPRVHEVIAVARHRAVLVALPPAADAKDVVGEPALEHDHAAARRPGRVHVLRDPVSDVGWNVVRPDDEHVVLDELGKRGDAVLTNRAEVQVIDRRAEIPARGHNLGHQLSGHVARVGGQQQHLRAPVVLRDRKPRGNPAIVERPPDLPGVVEARVRELRGQLRRGALEGGLWRGHHVEYGGCHVVDIEGRRRLRRIREDERLLPPEVDHQRVRGAEERARIAQRAREAVVQAIVVDLRRVRRCADQVSVARRAHANDVLRARHQVDRGRQGAPVPLECHMDGRALPE